MGFVVNVNGEKVWEIDDKRVVRVGLQSSEGEAGAVGIDRDQTAVNLIIEFANPGELNVVDLDRISHPKDVDAEAAAERQTELDKIRPVSNESVVGGDNLQAAALTSTALTEAPAEPEEETSKKSRSKKSENLGDLTSTSS